MLQKFKNFSKAKKIIVGFIAFILLPITLLALSIELAYTGIKNKKFGKGAIGSLLSILLIYSFATYESPEPDLTTGDNSSVETSSNEKDTTADQEKKSPSLTKDELMKKLETYEGIYSVIPSAIQEASNGTDKLEMQKTFADSRDILQKGWSDLSDLKSEYDSKSDEYKTVENLHMAYYTLMDACKNGIKYLDKNEFKYFEKYEDNCKDAGAWLNDYLVYKEKIQ